MAVQFRPVAPALVTQTAQLETVIYEQLLPTCLHNGVAPHPYGNAAYTLILISTEKFQIKLGEHPKESPQSQCQSGSIKTNELKRN